MSNVLVFLISFIMYTLLGVIFFMAVTFFFANLFFSRWLTEGLKLRKGMQDLAIQARQPEALQFGWLPPEVVKEHKERVNRLATQVYPVPGT